MKQDICGIIEKRVRKEIRINKLFSKNDKLYMSDDKTEKGVVLNYLLKKIITNPTIKIVKKNYDKRVLSWNLDDEAITYLKSKFTNNKVDLLHSKKEIKPLIGVTKQELLRFCKAKKLEFKESKPIDNDLQIMIDDMERKIPGTKFGILKTIRKTI